MQINHSLGILGNSFLEVGVEKASWKLTKSIMILILIVLLLCSLLLGYVLFSLRDSLIRSSYLATEIIDQSLDSRLKELRKYCLNIELSPTNSRIKRLMTLTDDSHPLLYELVNQIQSYKYLNHLIEGIFIYYPALDWIVGNIGSYTSSSYYVLDNDLQPDGFEPFMEKVQQGTGEVFLTSHKGQPQLYYRKRMLYEGNLVGYLLIRLDIDQLLLFSQTNWESATQEYAFGLSLDGQNFAASGNTLLLEEVLKTQPQVQDGGFLFDRTKMLQSRSTSLTGLSYHLVLLLDEQLRPVTISLWISIAAILVIALIALSLALFLGKQNTRPLIKLLQQVGATEKQVSVDAYTLLSKRIDELLEEKDTKIRGLQYQKEAMGPLFLHHLLSGRIETEQDAVALLRRYNICFEYPFYVIGIIRLENGNPTYLLRAILLWARESEIDLLVTEKENDLVILYTSDEYLNYDSAVSSLTPLFENISLLKDAKATLGTWHDCLSMAMQSYHEALVLLNHAPKGVWWYQLENKDCSSSLLINTKEAVFNHHFEQAVSIFEELLARCIPEVLETSFAQTQLKEIETMIQEAGIGLAEPEGEPSISRRCMQNLKTLALKQKSKESTHDLSVADWAATIIDRDFTDPLLGLYRIAEELKLSNSYLSTVFKAQHGIGIVQFINQKRIDLAKELIVNTELSIKDIALACGFSSDISFIRVFKRHEAKTPGTLRKE